LNINNLFGVWKFGKKLKLRLQVSERLATYTDQSNYQANQQLVLRFALRFNNLTSSSCVKMLGQNHFPEPKGHVLTFLHPIFFCRATLWTPVERYYLGQWGTRLGFISDTNHPSKRKYRDNSNLVLMERKHCQVNNS
jgi:hypothetical protein